MPKETKELITKKGCAEELVRRQYVRLYICVAGTLLGALLLWIGCGGLSDTWQWFWGLEERDAVDVLLFAFQLLYETISILCGLLPACVLAEALVRIQRYKKLDFFVAEDTLLRSERETVRGARGYREVKAFYFLRCGRYVITPQDKSVFEYSKEEDRFYVMLYGKHQKPIAVYNQRVYEYRAEPEYTRDR